MIINPFKMIIIMMKFKIQAFLILHKIIIEIKIEESSTEKNENENNVENKKE